MPISGRGSTRDSDWRETIEELAAPRISEARAMIPAHRFRLALLPLVLYVALYPVLAVDVALRLFSQWSIQEHGNVVLLLFFELTRGLRSLLGLVLVALLAGKYASRRDARVLVLFLLFGEMAYGMAFSAIGYAGHFQEWLAGALLGLGLTRSQLTILFSHAEWALWLAWAASLRFAVLFPEQLTSDGIESSGINDRAGLMRGVPGAGVDVGSVFRKLAGLALTRGWLNAVPVWLAGATGAVLSVLLRNRPVAWLLWLPLLLGLALAVTCLRASYMKGEAETQVRLRWIARGSAAALVCFMLAGLIGLARGQAADIAVFVLLTLAPCGVLIGFGAAILQRRRSENVAPVVS